MERELCLILDKEGYHRLVLKKGTIGEIDGYTSRYFESNDDIRKKFEKEINEFLEKYKDALAKSNNPNYKGRLAVVIPEQVGKNYTDYQRTVLLKKHIVVFNKYIKHKPVMVQFISRFGKNFSEFFLHSIYKSWSKNNTKTKINEWLKELKKDKNVYYDMVRNFLIVYERISKSNDESYRLNIPTIDAAYEEYKAKKANKLKEKLKKTKSLKLDKSNHEVKPGSVVYEEEKVYTINGSNYTQEELEQFDLDDLKHIEDSDFKPDGLGENEKTIK